MNMMIFALAAAAAQQQLLFSTGGAYFAVSVPDVEASADWYSKKMGLEVVSRPPKRGGAQMIALAGGGLLVELIEQDGALPLKQAAPQIAADYLVHGIFKAGVIVDDWDRLVAGLQARGVPVVMGPYPRMPEQRANLVIRDNNGNYIQFFENWSPPAERKPASECAPAEC